MYPMYFLSYISQLILRVLTKLKPTEKWGKSYLKKLEQQYQGEFEKHLFEKVAKYQSIQLHLVANTFSALFGRANTKTEEENNILYFLMTALYDDLIDNHKMDEVVLNELFYHPEHANPVNFNERVLVGIHLELLNRVPDKAAYWQVIENIHQAQKDSALQFDAAISYEKIIDITLRKGGYSLLMCRHYLKDPIYKEIDDCWYSIGGLIQMTNDLYDTYKDTQEGIHTFANSANNIDSIIETYHNQIQVLRDNIQQLPVSQKRKKQFAISLAIIPAFGYIAINQLSKIQNARKLLPDFKSIPRKALIIDMEKPLNVFRLILHAYKIGKLWM
jgi:hypothetical protein